MVWEGFVCWSFPIPRSGRLPDHIAPLLHWEPPSGSHAGILDSGASLLRARAPVIRHASVLPSPGQNTPHLDASWVGQFRGHTEHSGLVKGTERQKLPVTEGSFDSVALSSFVPYLRAGPGTNFFEKLIYYNDCAFCPSADFTTRGEESYLMMAVKREDGIAYRKGIGAMYKRDWEALEPQLEDVVLG